MVRQPARRPLLIPSVRRLWRGPRRLQVGTDPARAVVLELADPAQARLLDLLDGSHTERGLLLAAAEVGIAAADASALLGALTAAGYVVDAHGLQGGRADEATRRRLATETSAVALLYARPPRPAPGPAGLPTALLARDSRLGVRQRPGPPMAAGIAMRRRSQARVLVTGQSQLAVPIASMLAASGIGQVHVDQSGVTRLSDASPAGLLPTDAHRPRGVAAADAVRRVAPDIEMTHLARGRATFVVLVGFAAPASLTAFSYGTRRLAHLALCVRDGTVVVGPLVRPGLSPCLNCLELHRQDLDPDWRAVVAQLHTSPDVGEPVTATTALAAAAFASFEVLTQIDGGTPGTLGATVEIAEPGRHARRQWSQHPSCGCGRRRRRVARGTTGPA
jgi:bacteriocin biosynthesis cyclodehydratase domain-containing protein